MSLKNDMVERLEELKEKAKNAKTKNESKISEELEEAKSSVVASEENFRLWVEKTKDEAFSEIITLKMKNKLNKTDKKEAQEEKKFEKEKEKNYNKVEKAQENAIISILYSINTFDDAMVAYLNALQEEADFVDKYKED